MAAATEQAVAQLRRLILHGDLVPGARLQEVDLAAQLGVSRTPVREALRALSSEGLVEVSPNRGARVAQWSTKDLEEIYELRSMLESHAAYRAATRMQPVQVQQLAELCDQMEGRSGQRSKDDLLSLSELNGRFHALIVEAADSDRLSAMLASVVQIPLVLQTFSRYSPQALARSMSHHQELVDAMRARSPEWASSVMRSHIIAAGNVLVSLDKSPLLESP